MTGSAKQSVNLEEAKIILENAISIGSLPSFISKSTWDKDIKNIINGTHLTYRYILVTGLLGKATNDLVNPLALQAGSSLQGAYDARSLCHRVVVPVEVERLNRGLGSSNEPFLNKPARFKEISLSNAVRSGKDQQTLEILHKVLSGIKSQEEAFEALCSAIYYVIHKNLTQNISLQKITLSNPNHLKILEIINDFIASSIEGQTSVLAIGTTLALFYKNISNDFKVIVHPVNQSGASSREIADIDIKKADSSFASIEVKDKAYTDVDVEHAAFKASKYSLQVITFATGPNARYSGNSFENLSHKVYQKTGVSVVFVNVLSICHLLISLQPDCTIEDFIQTLNEYIVDTKAKDQVSIHLKQILDKK